MALSYTAESSQINPKKTSMISKEAVIFFQFDINF